MAQPPLSQAINRLEEKLGFSLLLRNKRAVRLTRSGCGVSRRLPHAG
ncbi:LysR family transcriptional regulator [Pseudomonas peli]